jgi:hypothetical protein
MTSTTKLLLATWSAGLTVFFVDDVHTDPPCVLKMSFPVGTRSETAKTTRKTTLWSLTTATDQHLKMQIFVKKLPGTL